MRHPTIPDDKKLRFWHGVEDAKANAIASRAFKAVVTLRAVTAVQTTPEQVGKEFAEWYEHVGRSLLFCFDASDPCAGDSDDESDASELEAEIETQPHGQDQRVVEALTSLSKEAELKKDIEELQAGKSSAPVLEPEEEQASLTEVLKNASDSPAMPAYMPASTAAEETQTQTLAEMLAVHGLNGYQPPDDDSMDQDSWLML